MGKEDIDVLRTFIFRPNFGAYSSCVKFQKPGLVSVNILLDLDILWKDVEIF